MSDNVERRFETDIHTYIYIYIYIYIYKIQYSIILLLISLLLPNIYVSIFFPIKSVLESDVRCLVRNMNVWLMFSGQLMHLYGPLYVWLLHVDDD